MESDFRVIWRVCGEGVDLRIEFVVAGLAGCGIPREITHLNLFVPLLQINPEGHQWWRSSQHVAFGTGAHPNLPFPDFRSLIKNAMDKN